MAQAAEHLLVFTRLPEPGKSKTRLIGAFGAERAVELYRALAHRTLQLATQFAAKRNCTLTVCFSGGDKSLMAAEFGSALRYQQQVNGELGQRLIHATQSAFEAGARRVVVLGTDCHTLTDGILTQAFDSLGNTSRELSQDIVIGPASDGGYYLIGLTQPQPPLFAGIEWGTERVCAQTRAIADMSGTPYAILPMLSDVDFPEDVISMRSSNAGFPAQLFSTISGKLSVVVPTLNEQDQLQHTLNSIGVPGPQLEIIVVDGGSSDHTSEIARDYGCLTFTVERGRGAQLNAGAAASSGETLMFLHADTRLPEGFVANVAACLDAGHIAGAFRLGIAGENHGLRIVEWGANMRSRWLQSPYGDQAIFLRASTFFDLGGFGYLPIMEDYEFVRRLRRLGRICLTPQCVVTSGRRWQKKGILRTTLVNQICVVLYRLGISPHRIASFYRRQR